MKVSDWFWGIATGTGGLVFVALGILDCLHLLDESNSGLAVGYLGMGVFMLVGSYFTFSCAGTPSQPAETPVRVPTSTAPPLLNVELVNYFGGERVRTETLNAPDPIPLSHAREADMIMDSLQCRDCDRQLDTNRLRLDGNILPYDATCPKCRKRRTINFSIPLFG